MLNLACRNTNKLIRNKSKSENVRLGRLFTKKETAKIMVGMFRLEKDRKAYTILDPGAGTGILSAALIERICREVPACKNIFLTCYENDPVFLPVLLDNLERLRKKARHDFDVRLLFTVYEENYLLSAKDHYTVTYFESAEDTYDLIVCHPPMDLCDKTSDEAQSVSGVTRTKIRLCYLFAETALHHMEKDGQAVFVLPTELASADALSAFRATLEEAVAVSSMHLFVGKAKNKDRAVPLRKNMILALSKGQKPETVAISVSPEGASSAGIEKLPPLPYRFIVHEKDGKLTLPKSTEDAKIVRFIENFSDTLGSLGLKMYTGLILDSRCRELIFNDEGDGVIPLIRPYCLTEGIVRFPGTVQTPTSPFPIKQKQQYLAPDAKCLMQKNKNLLMIKRVPAKSDGRLVNAAIYLASSQPKYQYIATHNKITFIDMKDKNKEMDARVVFGLYALLNSTIYDRYLSIVSKSKQINAKEFKDLPLPPMHLIENIGMRLLDTRSTSVTECDAIVNKTLHIIDKREN